ncbi:ATP-binding protein, partial [Ferrovibrio sp.]
PALACARAPRCAGEYQARISGPLLDRIDLALEVPAVSATDLSAPPPREGSEAVAARVARARDIQRDRYRSHGIRTNAEADGELLDRVAAPEPAGRDLLTEAAGMLHLTARGYHRVLRVARTLADLQGDAAVRRIHIAEALGYRRLAFAR